MQRYFWRPLLLVGLVAKFSVADLLSELVENLSELVETGNTSVSDDSADDDADADDGAAPSDMSTVFRRTSVKEAPTGGPQIDIRIGWSTSVKADGLFDKYRCFWCIDALTSAAWWSTWLEQTDFRTFEDRRLTVDLSKLEDFGIASVMLENYQKLCERKGDDEIDFLLGPAYGLFNVYAARVAQKYKKILLLWAFDDGESTNYMHFPGPEYTSWQNVVPQKMSIEQLLTTDPGIMEPLPTNNMYNAAWDTLRSYDVTFDYYNSDDYGNYTFNVNHQDKEWPNEAIKMLYDNGARYFMFVNPTDQSPGWYNKKAQPYYPSSVRLNSTCAKLTGTRCRVFNMTMNIMSSIRVLRVETPDAFVFSGSLQDQETFVLNLKAFNVKVKALMFDRPTGQLLTNTMRAYNINYFSEAFPVSGFDYQDPIFGSRTEWNVRYRQSSEYKYMMLDASAMLGGSCTTWGSRQPRITYPCCKRSKGHPNYPHVCPPRLTGFAALQVAAAASLLTQALQYFGALPDVTRTERIMRFFKENRSATIMGEMLFKENGHRVPLEGSLPSARQFRPLSELSGTPEERYNRSSIYSPAVPGDLTYPALQWFQKEIEVYPCRAGCVLHRHECVPCPAGHYRGRQDLICRSCLDQPGVDPTYATSPGMPECAFVLPGGELAKYGHGGKDPAALPIAKKYFFPVEYKELLADFGEKDPAHEDYLTACVADNASWSSAHFSPCLPKTLCVGGDATTTCVGSNQGLLCGQCAEGSSWKGPLLGMHRCSECGKVWVWVLVIAVPLVYALLHRSFSQAAEKIARNSGSMKCAVTRIVLHWAHLMGFALTGTAMDADGVHAILAIPIQLLSRPIEFARMDCLLANNAGVRGDILYRDVCVWSLPIYVGLLLLKPICRTAYRVIKSSYVLTRKPKNVVNGAADDFHETPGRPPWTSVADWDKAVKADPYLDKRYPLNQDSKWSIVRGSGRKFAMHHEAFAVTDDLQTLVREFIVFLILAHPAVFHACLRLKQCSQISALQQEGSTERLKANLDIVCGSREHDDLLEPVLIVHWTMSGILIGILLLALATGRSSFFSINWRLMFSVLFEGHRPDRISWELWAVLRILLMYEANGIAETMMMRSFFMLVLMGVSMMLLFWMEPFDKRDRDALMGLELKANISLMATLAAGIIVQMEIPDVEDSRATNDMPENLAHFIAALPVIAHAWFLINALAALAYDAALEVDIILSHSHFNVDSGTRLMMRVLKGCFRGMNPVRLYIEGDRAFIDVSRLNKHERNFLVSSLIETVFACIDSGQHFHTILLENAICLAFERAKQVREAKLMNSYYKYGSNPYWLVDCIIFKLFKVELRPPDILSHNRHEGVTVEELHAALSSVNIDILMHHPSLFNFGEGRQEEEVAEEVQNVVVWNLGASIKTLEDDLQQQGTVAFQHAPNVKVYGSTRSTRSGSRMGSSGSIGTRSLGTGSTLSLGLRRRALPGEGILEEMEATTTRQRQGDESAEEIQLEDDLNRMELKVWTLEEELFAFREQVDISSLTQQQRIALDSLGNIRYNDQLEEVNPEMRAQFQSSLTRRHQKSLETVTGPSKGALKVRGRFSNADEDGRPIPMHAKISDLTPEPTDSSLIRNNTTAQGVFPSVSRPTSKQTSI